MSHYGNYEDILYVKARLQLDTFDVCEWIDLALEDRILSTSDWINS